MSEFLFIHITDFPHNKDPLTAELIPCVIRSSSESAWNACTLADINSDGFTSVTVYIPGLHVLSTHVCVPKAQLKYLPKILPFLCEEKLACDIDSVHIATGRPQGELVPVRITQRSLLEGLLKCLQALGLSPDAVYADNEPFISLVQGDQQLLWVDEQGSLIITHEASQPTPFCSIPEQAPTLINTLNTQQPLFVYRQTLSPDTLNSTITLALEKLISQGMTVVEHSLPRSNGNISHLARLEAIDSSPLNTGINLLTGTYAPNKTQGTNVRWQLLALTATLLLGLNVLYLMASGYFFSARADQLQAATETLYRQYFPQDQRIVNIRTQTQNHLNSTTGNGQSDFFVLLNEVHNGWGQFDNQLTLKSIRFNKSRQEMLLDIESDSIQQLDQLRRSLGDQAELLSASESNLPNNPNGIRGRLKIAKGS
ncbi:hypothetical protein G8770_00080 [Aestuariicella hydrocarbonica]|uniref:Type II secretion system protein L n=1 Tax=Pseudomaricurvus hydrocarbonicus TaxID=1470433 RepID=A0A9E5JSQ6_9GAMM|nr:type II secretion system protein GspL [Aestuariicella hydrocarbonica]NHO63945.1 hypothetical protein [Aestuariicella hydrocarbonica]